MVHLLNVDKTKGSTTKARAARPALYRGVCSRVALSLGVSLSIVARVAKGTAVSARIEKALLDEERRIERSLRRDLRRAA